MLNNDTNTQIVVIFTTTTTQIHIPLCMANFYKKIRKLAPRDNNNNLTEAVILNFAKAPALSIYIGYTCCASEYIRIRIVFAYLTQLDNFSIDNKRASSFLTDPFARRFFVHALNLKRANSKTTCHFSLSTFPTKLLKRRLILQNLATVVNVP